MHLPQHFCWTRFGTEAGQSIEHIIARKEQERISNGGVFFWGIGNAIGASLRELLKRCSKPEVLFSPIKSRARAHDAAPEAVAAWISGETLDGDPFRLPTGSIVTSRYDLAATHHVRYALVCLSQTPLSMSQSEERIDFGELRNLLSGRPMGASQVTAVVERDATAFARASTYDVAMRAELVSPYFVRLQNPLQLSAEGLAANGEYDWGTAVRRFIEHQTSDRTLEETAPRQRRLWKKWSEPSSTGE
jgi:hypothetical protein